MKNLFFATFCCLLIGFSSCDKNAAVAPSENLKNSEIILQTKSTAAVDSIAILNALRQENVVFFDARVRALNEQKFIKEVVVVDFSPGKNLVQEVVMYNNMAYVDNGSFFDLRAGDGVFTSVEAFIYTETITPELVRGTAPVSVLRAPIVNVAFNKKQELASYARTYQVKGRRPGSNPTGLIEVECEVSSGGTNCPAVHWGLCSSCCIIISNCKVTVGI
jgi:hypothetical protein